MTALAHVAPDYAHYAKQAVPQGVLRIGTSRIKYYHLERPGEPVPQALSDAARAFLADEGGERAGLGGDQGFAILHRCGADFHFLLIAAWRGSNEVWEAVWHHQGAMTGFAPFAPAYPAAIGTLRPTFCVWELGIVAHEAAAWARLLAGEGGPEDLARWQDDLFAGIV